MLVVRLLAGLRHRHLRRGGILHQSGILRCGARYRHLVADAYLARLVHEDVARVVGEQEAAAVCGAYDTLHRIFAAGGVCGYLGDFSVFVALVLAGARRLEIGVCVVCHHDVALLCVGVGRLQQCRHLAHCGRGEVCGGRLSVPCRGVVVGGEGVFAPHGAEVGEILRHAAVFVVCHLELGVDVGLRVFVLEESRQELVGGNHCPEVFRVLQLGEFGGVGRAAVGHALVELCGKLLVCREARDGGIVGVGEFNGDVLLVADLAPDVELVGVVAARSHSHEDRRRQ